MDDGIVPGRKYNVRTIYGPLFIAFNVYGPLFIAFIVYGPLLISKAFIITPYE